VVRLAVGQGDRASAADAARRAAEAIAAGATPSRLAAAAYCQGLLDKDADLLLQAADGYAKAGRPLPRAQALEAAAALLAEGGGVAAARAPFVAAMGLYTELGTAWDLHRSRARFRPYGLRQPTRRLNRPTTGWEALTTAETRVAELVAKGLSNPEIARELVVARPTVETHVARVLAKLQVRSRIDVARAAATRVGAQAAR
jgi:DNA-binding CsgD family transcriptional regulator